MKFLLALLVSALVAGVAHADTPSVAQIFYVPMPEAETMNEVFMVINAEVTSDSRIVTSLISIAVSVDNTQIWWDHHGDEYQSDYATLIGTTEVWGDDNCYNGYAPNTFRDRDDCVAKGDILKAGQSIVIETVIDADYNSQRTPKFVLEDGYGQPNEKLYDGGDKVVASYPIAMTRGMYPGEHDVAGPGSLMAGALEVFESREWGSTFVMPVSSDEDSLGGESAFESVTIFVQALKDNTAVTFKGGVTNIDQGETVVYHVSETGAVLTTNDESCPVQVSLITGDVHSTFELRWFALLPFVQWTNDYFSPVSDDRGRVKFVIFNPHDQDIDVTVTMRHEWWEEDTDTYLDNSGYLGKKDSYQFEVKSRKAEESTWWVPDYTGAQLTSSKPFIALATTHTNDNESGQIYDWGFPVMPTNKLTHEVLIGWGFGCTSHDCSATSEHKERSVVWISPVEKADIYVDYDNDGSYEKVERDVEKLESIELTDGGDKDMSGAKIVATEPGKNPNTGPYVKIAAAWGQDSSRSYSGDGDGLDLGTVVPPFPSISVMETIRLLPEGDANGDGKINPGDIAEYTIAVTNGGVRTYDTGDFFLKYPWKSENLEYQIIDTSFCKYFDGMDGEEYSCGPDFADKLSNGGGLPNPIPLDSKSGKHLLKFRVTVVDPDQLEETMISNNGILHQPGWGPDLTYSAEAPVYLEPSIDVIKTVYDGTSGTNPCVDGLPDLALGEVGDGVTFCYKVKNDGTSYLEQVEVTDPDIGLTTPITVGTGRLAPGEYEYVPYQTTFPDLEVGQQRFTFVTATGEPRLVNGDDIDTYIGGQVFDRDDAGLEIIETLVPDISIEKTVHLTDIGECSPGQEKEYGYEGTVVTYCYEVENTGDLSLEVTVKDLDVTTQDSDCKIEPSSMTVEPGPSKKVFFKSLCKIFKNLNSYGTAEGTTQEGEKVDDRDDAGVILVKRPDDPECPPL